MRNLVVANTLALLLVGSAYAGGGEEAPVQQSAPQTKIVISEPREDFSWTPVIVALIGAAGLLGSAYLSYNKKS